MPAVAGAARKLRQGISMSRQSLEEPNNGEEKNHEPGETVLPAEDYPGKDPLGIPCYPGSVRTQYLENSFARYMARATVGEVVSESFGLTLDNLDNEEDYKGYVGWTLYAKVWPED